MNVRYMSANVPNVPCGKLLVSVVLFT